MVLGTFTFTEQYVLPTGFGVQPSSTLIINFGYSIPPNGPEDAATAVFDSFTRVAGDDLRTLVLSGAGDDPQFPAFLARATNGLDDELRVSVIGNNGGGGGTIDLESNVLHTARVLSGPDLAGTTLTGLEAFISAIQINPRATSGEVNWSVSGELRFVGELAAPVPLPASGWLLASAGLLLARRRRRFTPHGRCHEFIQARLPCDLIPLQPSAHVVDTVQ